MTEIEITWTEEVTCSATISLETARELYHLATDEELPDTATAEEIVAALKDLDLDDVFGGDVEPESQNLEARVDYRMTIVKKWTRK